jgi:hypothetical protein
MTEPGGHHRTNRTANAIQGASQELATTAPANNAICIERFICGGPGQPGERLENHVDDHE